MKMIQPASAKRATVLLLLMMMVSTAAFAGGYYGRSDEGSSLGVRVGWSGGVTGLTFRRVFAPGQAFEINAGYNIKEGRRWPVPAYAKGNVMVDARYQPFLFCSDGMVGFAGYGSVGARARFHNYRVAGEYKKPGSVVTPDVLAGGGVQFEFNESVEIFGDIHAKYYNRVTGSWVWGLESGLGIRVKLG